MDLEIQNGQIVERQANNQTITFYDHPLLDVEASQEAGQRKYVMKPYIKIATRGSKDVFSRLATEQDEKQYPQEWASFVSTKKNGGTHLNNLPLEPTRILELSSQGYESVEQLAESEENEAQTAKGYLKLAELNQ